jgi:A/G-specific adenine glycosylase
LQAGCEARKTNRINDLPVKIKSLKIRERYFNYIFAQKDGQILINKRGAGDIWENMFDLPLFETENFTPAQDLIRSEDFIRSFGAQVKIRSVSAPVKHILSHQKLYTSFIEIEEFSEGFISERSWFYVSPDELENLAQPKLIFQFFENFHKLNT